MQEPLVSIITPVYNSEKFIAATIESVLNQTYQNWEHLIVDDCSTDHTLDIVNDYVSKDKRIKCFRLNFNSGSGVARNHAIERAGGRYISFLDSDDIWKHERLEKHIRFMLTVGAAFSHSSYGFIKEDGTIYSKAYYVRKKLVDYKFLLRKTDISCLTAIYDQTLTGKFFMPDIRRKQDYGLWLSLLKAGYASVPFPEVLAYYRQRKGSATNKKHELIIQHYRFLREHEELSRRSSLKYTVLWGIGGIKKYLL